MIQKSIEASIIQYALDFAAHIKKGGDMQCQAHGITTQQWLILLHLANDPNVPFTNQRDDGQPVLASQLADFFKVSRASVTNLLKVLLEKKLIQQTEDENDKRCKFLELTDEGKKLIFLLEPGRAAANEKLFSSFSADEKTQFYNFLRRSVTHLSLALQAAKTP